ncbi:MAG: glutamine amidotransferase [Bacteroidia bacterium]|nr:glutamine amidotransferase [Bacteroidia bacterium]
MKKLLILQMRPEDEPTESEFETILRIGEIDKNRVHRIRVEQGKEPDVDLEDYFAIIAGGSPFDVSCPPEKKSDAQKQVESFFNHLFDKVIPNDFPFLGACSGNGLLGNYLGSKISRAYGEPIGTVMIHITDAGGKDDLLTGLPSPFRAFVGHKEACDTLPQNAVLLATSDTCPVQMFRIKNNIYATQFHPEADEGEYIVRIRAYKNYGYFPPEEADTLLKEIKGVKTPYSHEVLRRFVAKYKSGPEH